MYYNSLSLHAVAKRFMLYDFVFVLVVVRINEINNKLAQDVFYIFLASKNAITKKIPIEL
jgi:hypothetical protein